MNTEILQQKVDDVIALFRSYAVEAKTIEAARTALENTTFVNTDREKRLNHREIALTQRAKDLDAEKKYIDEKNVDVQTVLNKIVIEKQSIGDLKIQREALEKERLQLEMDKREIEKAKQERDAIIAERTAFEQERSVYAKEKAAVQEQQQMLTIREQNVRAKEERIDRIERMTQV